MNEEKSPALIRVEKVRQRSQAAGKSKQINDATSRPDQQPAQKAQFKKRVNVGEAKTRRVQLLMKQSTYDKIKQKAELDDVSINDAIAQLIENYC